MGTSDNASSAPPKKEQKTYHKQATGSALNTVNIHSKDEDLKLYGGCFCPFVQRVWISLEIKGTPYQYIEVDPYAKPKSLLEINPRGLIPALRHGPDWACHESSVLMEYLEDLGQGQSLLPADPKLRATSRLWCDHINRNIIPTFYHLLQSQTVPSQAEHTQSLKQHLSTLVQAADTNGPFFLGSQISFVDVQIAPWALRFRRVLGPYRGWNTEADVEAEEKEAGATASAGQEGKGVEKGESKPWAKRWAQWLDALENNEHVQATTSTDELYLDSYERYAENRPNTSQVANAINSGRGLP